MVPTVHGGHRHGDIEAGGREGPGADEEDSLVDGSCGVPKGFKALIHVARRIHTLGKISLLACLLSQLPQFEYNGVIAKNDLRLSSRLIQSRSTQKTN